jgi:uroporphyrinogen-III synthase
MGEYDWLVFTSPNGVRGFFNRFFERFADIRSIGGVKIACVGPATEKAVRALQLEPDITSTQADGLSLGKKMMDSHDMENQKILMATGNLSSPELASLLLDQAMAIVDVLKVYATEERPVTESPEAAEFRRRGADIIVFASPSAVNPLFTKPLRYVRNQELNNPKLLLLDPRQPMR